MLSLTFGLAAALCWGVHDVCVRLAAERAGVNLALLTVLATGLALILPLALWAGNWQDLTTKHALAAIAAGVVYAGASYGLYRAFAIGPVRLVAPVIAAYPILSVIWAALQGNPPTPGQVLAVMAIVAGVGLIAVLTQDDGPTQHGGHDTGRQEAMLWALAASAGFALTFALGQTASSGGAELPAAALSRATAVATLAAGLMIATGGLPRAKGAPWGLLVTMGVCDVTAITLVLSAGGLPRPEFAAVASSIFGMVTILLAWAFLGERISRLQWGAVGLVFAGIGYLAV